MPTEIDNELEKLKKINAELLAKTRKLRDKVTALETEKATFTTAAETQTAALTSKLERAEDYAKQQIVQSITREMFTVERFGRSYVSDRLQVKLGDDGAPTVTVMQEDGTTATKLSLDEFRKQLRETKELAPLLIGSRASGGGTIGTPSHRLARARTIEPAENTTRLNLGLR